jgi:hypothetical protein
MLELPFKIRKQSTEFSSDESVFWIARNIEERPTSAVWRFSSQIGHSEYRPASWLHGTPTEQFSLLG